MVNKPLIRPAISGGGTLGGGRLTSHDLFLGWGGGETRGGNRMREHSILSYDSTDFTFHPHRFFWMQINKNIDHIDSWWLNHPFEKYARQIGS